ncbi:VaFE repeat-containing surface-anchored protein [Corynebacterium sp. zg912]|uniref:VaFE repeat-containing surface-anchored protein n=1 Tax=Corynebacterium sp. zg912 TaxID=2656649 RepID=UPI002151CAA4|nr:VaFE repeat-containing surface-anchored protein [Corynebacterium sp. zg912]MCR5929307.1 VaFE repeat-containing surface-anchored protein [Corynebacterium sp. zg912]
MTETQPGKTTTETQPDVTETQPGKTTTETQPDVTETQPGKTTTETQPDVTETQPGKTTTETQPDVTETQPGTTVTSTAPTVTVTETPTTTATVPTETVTTTVKQGFKPNPEIRTRAEFKDGASQVIAGATVVDTVSYYGLVAGKNYTLDAKLVDKQDAKRVLGTGAVTFKAEGTEGELVNGSVKVEIAVNENVTEPVQAAVAFERLTSTEVNAQGEDTDGKKSHDIAKHEDIADEAQTVRTVFEPSIATNAKFANGSSEVVAGNKVIDTVEYKGLVPGKEYTLTAKLMERLGEAGSYRAGRVLGEGTKTFTPKTTDGFVDVTITVNDDVTTPVAAAVAFEELTSTEVNRGGKDNPQGGNTPEDRSDDNKIAEHKDINDGNQTVEGPVTTPTPTTSEESTTETTTTEVTTTEGTTEATTPVAEPSTSETAPSSTPVVPLVPSNPEGKIDTKVTVNGQAIVDGKPVTVTEQDVNNGLKVTDEITYSGLVAGTKYRFEGQLQHVEFNEAGEVVKVTPVTEVKSTNVVAAENGNGTASVDFGTLTELIPGATYVVYERAIPLDGNDQPTTDPNGEPKDPSKDNRKVVEHKDPKDKAQTFEVVKTPTTTPTSPVAPSTTPDKCVPVTTVSTVPGTTVAETTVPGTTVPETTVPGTPETPGSTVPGTTVPGTTAPGTTVAPSTVPATTLPEHCVTTTPVAPTTEPTQPTETVPAQPSTTEKPSKETTPTVPSSTTTPVVPPVVWFPNPQIGTTADFTGGAKEVKSGVVVNDTVKYQGLVPGKTYTLTAELVSKDAFNNLADKNAYGESVIGTGTKTFTASETGNGSVVVEIAVNEGIDTPVRAAVAFETLTSTEVNRDGQDNPQGGETPGDTSDDNQIAEHKNIDDQNQTVRSPKTPGTPPVFEGAPAIGTNANFATGSKEVVAGATIVDTVRYSGLVPGKTYTLTADLVAKYNGAVIGQGEKRFTASENGFGAVDVDITVSSWVKEPVYAAVAFERLTSTEVDVQGNELPEGNRVPAEIAQHRDINDAAQTVISPNTSEGSELPQNPGVSTNADFANGAEVVNGAVVRDAVKYWGLVPGKTYTATAQLIERVGDKAPYSEGRVLGTQSVTFTPENTFGEINVDIPVTNAEGAVIAAVAFETLTSTEVDRNGKDNPKGGNTPDDYSDDNEIAEHKDINDSYQTVKTSEGVPPTTSQETPGTSTEETTPAPVPSETTTPATTTPVPSDGGTSDEGSSVDKDKLKWLLLIPGLGLIPALLGGGGGSSKPAPKPAPQPVPSKPAPAPAPSAPAGQAPKPAGQPVPADSPRGEIKQIPSGGTALEADMPAYI